MLHSVQTGGEKLWTPVNQCKPRMICGQQYEFDLYFFWVYRLFVRSLISNEHTRNFCGAFTGRQIPWRSLCPFNLSIATQGDDPPQSARTRALSCKDGYATATLFMESLLPPQGGLLADFLTTRNSGWSACGEELSWLDSLRKSPTNAHPAAFGLTFFLILIYIPWLFTKHSTD